LAGDLHHRVAGAVRANELDSAGALEPPVFRQVDMANLGRLAVVGGKVTGNRAARSGGGTWARGDLFPLDVFARNVPDHVASPRD
jgi:hypothetical protein